MTWTQTALSILCVLGIAVGQILFKLAARSTAADDLRTLLPQLAMSPPFLAALVLYGCLTLLWVWILRTASLSQAYPLFALSFVFVPLLGYLFLGEPLGLAKFAGAALIIAGILVIGPQQPV